MGQARVCLAFWEWGEDEGNGGKGGNERKARISHSEAKQTKGRKRVTNIWWDASFYCTGTCFFNAQKTMTKSP